MVVLAGAAAVSVPTLGHTRSTDPDPTLQLAGGPTARPAARDPWRRFNRRSFAFSGVLDRVIIGPVARVYRRVTPAPLRRGLGNALANLREPSTAVNGVLQGRPAVSARAAARFVTNSTIGVLGLFDVAGRAGLDREPADFGQTLGRYGIGQGPYLYLPVVGPTTLRDGLGAVVNLLGDPVSQATGGLSTDFALSRSIMRGLDARAEGDETLQTIMTQSTDPYATIQSGYLQNRAAFVRAATGAEDILPDFDPVELTAEPIPTVEATAEPIQTVEPSGELQPAPTALPAAQP
ncbi:MAG: VacJ family lipoprotein [Caulobacter sp.]|nr:VacJ family lipoprotein [Caulobacter sp.]